MWLPVVLHPPATTAIRAFGASASVEAVVVAHPEINALPITKATHTAIREFTGYSLIHRTTKYEHTPFTICRTQSLHYSPLLYGQTNLTVPINRD
jgi:hypothetical protein